MSDNSTTTTTQKSDVPPSSSSTTPPQPPPLPTKEVTTFQVAMQKYSRLFRIFTSVSTHLRVRDRSVKILQYACQMLLGYYQTAASQAFRELWALTRRSCSNARKAFWLLKSVNHLGSAFDLFVTFLDEMTAYCQPVCIHNDSVAVDNIDNNMNSNQVNSAALIINPSPPLPVFAITMRVLEIVEQIFLVAYYAYENLVFLSRMKMIATKEEDIDLVGNWSWFISDTAGFLVAVMKFWEVLQTWLYKHGWLYRPQSRIADCKAEAPSSSSADCSSGSKSSRIYAVFDDLFCDDVGTNLLDCFTTVIITGLEMFVSADYCNVFKVLMGRGLGDAGVGFCGMFASILTVLEGFRNAARIHK